MIKHYLLAFLIGWAFNFAVDVTAVTRSSMDWLQYHWFAPFYDEASKQAARL